MTNEEIRNTIAEQIENLGYKGCANQIRANLKARENALVALKGIKTNTELLQQTIEQLLPAQTEKQNKIYKLFDIELNNELFHMHAGYGFIGAKECKVDKETAVYKYNRLKEELLKLVKPSEELNVLFGQYEQAAKEEYLIYAREYEEEQKGSTREEHIQTLILLNEQSETLEETKIKIRIKLANYLMDNIL